MYKARACGFEAELTAAEGEGLDVGAGVFDGSNVDPVREITKCTRSMDNAHQQLQRNGT